MFVAAMKTLAVIVGRFGETIKTLLKPCRSVETISAGAASDLAKSRAELIAQNALLRKQLIVLRRSVMRPGLSRSDRLILIILARLNHEWETVLHLVQPDTLLRWHRDLFKIL